MSPEERQLISSLFDRINTAASAPRDAEAEALIAEGVKRAPHAAYVMAQAVIVQEEALKAASGRIEQLEARVRELESKPAQPASSGFLGGIGGSLFGASRTASGVPAVPAPAAAPAPSSGSVWNRGGAAPVQPQQSFQQQPMGMAPQMQPQQAAGSGFLGNALATAAGVAGGALLFHGLQSAFSNHSSSILGNPTPSGAGFSHSDPAPVPTPPERASFAEPAPQPSGFIQEASYDAPDDGGSFGGGGDDSDWA